MADTYLNLILRASKTGTGAADAKRELSDLDRQIKTTHASAVQSTRAYFDMAQSLTQNSGKTNIARNALSGLNSEMQVGRLSTADYAAAAEKVGVQSGMLTPAALNAAKSINALNVEYTKTGNVQAYTSGLRAVQGELAASQPFMERYGNTVRTVAVVSLGALALGFADVARTSMQFEASMNQIVALTNTTQAEIGGMTDAVLKMSGEVGRAPKELAEGLYFISSSGFAGAQGLKILEASAKASAAGLGETKVVADAVTSTLFAYKMGAEQAARVTDLFIQVVKEGKGEPTALAGSLGRILPIASQAGVSFEQVGASMATMTLAGLSAEEAATALRGTLSSLLAPGKQARDALATLGLSADDVRKSIRERGLLVTLQDLMERTKGNIDTLDLIIPNIRALTGVLATAGSQGEQYAAILGRMGEATGETERAFSTASETMQFKANQVSASFDAVKISIGNMLLPALKSLLDTVKGVADSFTALDPSTQRLIVTMGALALSTAPAIMAITKIGSVIKGIGESVATFNSMRAAGDSVFKSLSALRTIEFGALAAGLTVIVTFLENVSEAASKSTEDLIKMAQSGGFFEQAAAATEIMAHGQDRLRAALDATHEKIKTGAKEYADYKSSIDATAAAAGYTINAQGDLVNIIKTAGGEVEKVVAAHYRWTEAEYAATQGAYGLNGALDESRGAGRLAAITMSDVAKADEQAGLAAEKAAAQQRDLATAVAIMSAGYGSAVSKEMTSFADKQTELKKKAEELAKQIKDLEAAQGSQITTGKYAALTTNEMTAAQTKLASVTEDLTLKQRKKKETDAEFAARMAGLAVTADNLTNKINGSGAAFVDNSKKIAELKVKYDEATAAINENAAAHDEAMKRIVLDIAQQQLAIGGWTDAEINGFTLVAQKMGVFDQASATLTANVLTATGQLAADGNAQTFANNLQTALATASSTADAAVASVGSVPDDIATAWEAKMARMEGVGASVAGALTAPMKTAVDTTALKNVPVDVAVGWGAQAGVLKTAGDQAANALMTPMKTAMDTIATDPALGLFGLNYNASMMSVQQATQNTATSIMTMIPPATSGLAADPNPSLFSILFGLAMSAVQTAAGNAASSAGDLKRAVDALQSKAITITTVYETRYTSSGSPPSSTPPSTPGHQMGGAVSVPTWVGEGGKELFFPPAGGGYVMNNADSTRLVRALEALANRPAAAASIAQGGGDTIIINDRMALAQFYDQRRRAKIDRSNARMGG